MAEVVKIVIEPWDNGLVSDVDITYYFRDDVQPYSASEFSSDTETYQQLQWFEERLREALRK